jgi:hypothetical protein
LFTSIPAIPQLHGIQRAESRLRSFAVEVSGRRFHRLGLAGHPDVEALFDGESAAGEYALKTIRHAGSPILLVAQRGRGDLLYAAYRLAEHLGVRFYLHGDVVPDAQAAFELPQLDEVRRPLFEHRGSQPFHDFPEGPDWWNVDAYKAVLAQLPKLGMNFFGLHTYPEGGGQGPRRPGRGAGTL